MFGYQGLVYRLRLGKIRWLLFLQLTLYYWIGPHSAEAAEYPAQVIISAEQYTNNIAQLTEALSLQLPATKVSFLVSHQLQDRSQFTDVTLITFGYALLQWRLKLQDPPPTLALQVSRSGLKKYWPERLPYSDNLLLLWSDPPVARQLYLIKRIFPHIHRVGVLYSTRSAELLTEAQPIAEKLNLSLHGRKASQSTSNHALQQLLQHSDVILAVHDNEIYNSATIKTVLLTSYSQHTALIGPSTTFIQAGSLATSYSSASHWLDTLVDWLEVNPKHWPTDAYPHHFSVMTNPQVARSLGVDLPPVEQLLLQLQQSGSP